MVFIGSYSAVGTQGREAGSVAVMLPVVVLSARENRCAFGVFLWAGRWVGWVWGFLGFVGVLGWFWVFFFNPR